MSEKKRECDKKSDVLGKLDKVADTLENTTNQLSGVVTQQQLDLVRERIIACESDIVASKGGMEILARRTAVHADESISVTDELDKKIKVLERDHAGLRALTLSAFVLSTIALMGLIIFFVL